MFQWLALSILLACVSGVAVLRQNYEYHSYESINNRASLTTEKLPYQVSIRFLNNHQCSGTILKHNSIITAAHCVTNYPIQYLTVVAGISDLSEEGIETTIKEVITHENYSSYRLDYDIAVVVLDLSLDFSETVQPIRLALGREEVRLGTIALASGWGAYTANGYSPSTIHYNSVVLISIDECEKYHSGLGLNAETTLCTNYLKDGLIACQGDSGGALVIEGRLYGIASLSLGCALNDFPGAFVKVSAFRDWISEFL